jgi:hypothetical protein
MPSDYYLRQAGIADGELLAGLIGNDNCLQHRHLDWRLPSDWLGYQPFWILGKDSTASAALSFPEDPPGIYWVRLFAALNTLRLPQTWRLLFEKALSTFPSGSRPIIPSLAVQKWYLDILLENRFSRLHDIVVLAWKNERC